MVRCFLNKENSVSAVAALMAFDQPESPFASNLYNMLVKKNPQNENDAKQFFDIVDAYARTTSTMTDSTSSASTASTADIDFKETLQNTIDREVISTALGKVFAEINLLTIKNSTRYNLNNAFSLVQKITQLALPHNLFTYSSADSFALQIIQQLKQNLNDEEYTLFALQTLTELIQADIKGFRWIVEFFANFKPQNRTVAAALSNLFETNDRSEALKTITSNQHRTCFKNCIKNATDLNNFLIFVETKAFPFQKNEAITILVGSQFVTGLNTYRHQHAEKEKTAIRHNILNTISSDASFASQVLENKPEYAEIQKLFIELATFTPQSPSSSSSATVVPSVYAQPSSSNNTQSTQVTSTATTPTNTL